MDAKVYRTEAERVENDGNEREKNSTVVPYFQITMRFCCSSRAGVLANWALILARLALGIIFCIQLNDTSSYNPEPLSPKVLHFLSRHIMSDPVSLTASVIAIAGLAYSSSKALYEVISAIRDAPQVFQDLNQYIAALSQILNALKTNLDGRGVRLS